MRCIRGITIYGFGINKNIFETNIINLTIVIGTVVFYGRLSILGDLLKNRRETIIKNIQDLDNKIRNSEEVLRLATSNLEAAKINSEEIREQGTTLFAIRSFQTSKTLESIIDEDIKRLKSVNVNKKTEEKNPLKLCLQLNLIAFKKAVEKITKSLNPKIHKKIVSRKIDKLSPRKLMRKKY
uniref:ATPase subunit I n=1 Tax=Euglena hiemalis TaxID=392896 RepID=A0A345UC28_9EUGL|nr:ATPase subunit I [Euglena hiemalis]AXI98014.1 ATPase subunit I [Euglena hiemalis]